MKIANITNRYYLIVSGVFLVFSSIATIIVIRHVFFNGIDTILKEEKDDIIKTLEYMPPLDDTLYLGKNISIYPVDKGQKIKDQYSIESIEDIILHEKIDYRKYKSSFLKDSTKYVIEIIHPVSESLLFINRFYFVNIFVLFTIMIISLFIISSYVNNKIWSPFYDLLEKLSLYNLENNNKIDLPDTKIEEFIELNNGINALINRTNKDYQSQKEFLENSSHEIKTPLAVITQTLDMLIQSPNLDESDHEKLGEIYEEVRRLNKLSTSLSILYKIENQHFESSELILFNKLVAKHVKQLEFWSESKHIEVVIKNQNELYFYMNTTLADVLISNILSNAIKHGKEHGFLFINITLNKIEFINAGKELNVPVEKLLNKFQKNTANEDTTSQGLGLNIIKKICDKYFIGFEYVNVQEYHAITLEFM
jgi:signal transduction histidine kinase